MKRRLLWVLNESDALLALGIAIVAGVLGLLNVVSSASLANNAILATLAVLALAVLRDRWRRSATEHEMSEAFTATSERLTELLTHMRGVMAIEELLTRTTSALEEIGVVRLLAGREAVAREHEAAREQTGRWLFRGGTGTYIRAVTLPGCIANARHGRRALQVRLEILDPTDSDACRRYARFRQTVADGPDGTGETWTVERTREEAYATILAACWHRAKWSFLDIEVGLTGHTSAFRYDMSSDRLIITQDSFNVPSLLITRESFLYDAYDMELQESLKQARAVPLGQAEQVRFSDEPTIEQVLELFDVLGLPVDSAEVHVPRIIQKAFHAKNPYE